MNKQHYTNIKCGQCTDFTNVPILKDNVFPDTLPAKDVVFIYGRENGALYYYNSFGEEYAFKAPDEINIIDNLESDDSEAVLSARQGKILKALIDGEFDLTNNEVANKVNYLEFNLLDERVLSAENTLSLQSKLISEKVNRSEFDSSLEILDDRIQSKVAQTDFDSLNNKVKFQESLISQTADQIKTKVSKTEFDNLENRVSYTESSITQHADLIATKVSQTAFDALGKKVAEAESQIKQTSEEISTKVGRTEFDEFGNRLSLAESAIKQTAEEIATKVSKYEFDEFGNRLTLAESMIRQTAEEISTKVTKTEFDALKNKVAENESSIIQHADEIALKVSKKEFNELGVLVEENKSSITQTAEQIQLKVDKTEYSELGKKVSEAQSSITQLANEISSKVSETDYNELEERVSSNESSITQTASKIESKVEKSQFDSLNNKVILAESSISQTADQIKTKVEKADFDKLGTRVSNTESSITQQAGLIATKVAQTTFDSLNTRVTTAESTITQQSNSIALKANSTDLNSLTNRVTTAEGSITTTASQVLLKADKTTTDSLGTRLSNAEATLSLTPDKISTAVSNIQIGGTNLLRNTGVMTNFNYWDWGISSGVTSNRSLTSDGDMKITITSSTSTGDSSLKQTTPTFNATTDSYVTISTEVVDISGTNIMGQLLIRCISEDGSYSDLTSKFTTNGKKTFTRALRGNTVRFHVWFSLYPTVAGGTGSITYRNCKLELGNKATDWSPSPLDIDDNFNTINTDLSTFKTSTNSSITQLSNSITTKVEQSVFNALGTRVANAESNISQTPTQISTAISNINVGGTNLFLNSSFDGISYWGKSNNSNVTLESTSEKSPFNQNANIIQWKAGGLFQRNRGQESPLVPYVSGTQYTISFYGKTASGTTTMNFGCEGLSIISVLLTTTWKKFTHTFTGNGSAHTIIFYPQNNATNSTYMTQPQIEIGNRDTDWSSSEFDTNKKIDTVDSALTTYKTATNSSITQLSNQIATKVESSTFNALGTRVSAAESAITQLPNQITLAVSDIQIGGENIIKNTRYNNGIANRTENDYLGLTSVYGIRPSSGFIDPLAYNNGIESIKPDTYYTLSFYIKGENNTDIVHSHLYPDATASSINSQGVTTSASDGTTWFKVSTEWQRVWVTYKTLSNASGAKSIITHRLQAGSGVAGKKVWVCGVKLEEGNKATSYTNNSDETNAAAQAAQTTANTAQTTANTAITNASTAQTTANSKTTLTEVTASMTITANGFTFNGKTFIVNSTLLANAIQAAQLKVGSKFTVLTDGTLTATGATINGNITATSGTIGGWNLGGSYLQSNNLTTNIGTNYTRLESTGAMKVFQSGQSSPLVEIGSKTYSEYNDRDSGSIVIYSSSNIGKPVVQLDELGLVVGTSLTGSNYSIYGENFMSIPNAITIRGGKIILNTSSLPTSSSGLASGTIYRSGNQLMIA